MNNLQAEPPENFRILSVSPTVKDLNNDEPYLRACKVKDPYDSVEHYLDVQFRALREDFVCPLRKGLNEYLKSGKNTKNNDLRVYKNVRLIASAEINKSNNVGIRVFFGKLKHVRWEDSKRFMRGGLVLMSSDNFNTIVFATICDRDEKKLKDGYVLIQPIDQAMITQGMYNETYDMLESKIYYEPYQAVLSAMQLMDQRSFPMADYLVNASNASRLPQYLNNKSLFSEIDTPWQAKKKRLLDVSQYNAFKHALSEEFAVIQGPPGTGKTFIALQIVKTLLKVKKLWLPRGPIVVVCFTNHALDQFLEGILEHTKSIIRIGDRSKSELLKPYTLREKRNLSIKNRDSGNRGNAQARKALFEARRNLESVLGDLSSEQRIIEYLTTPEAIVPLECLKYSVDATLKNMKTNEDLVQWLTGQRLNSVLQRSENANVPRSHNEETMDVELQEEEYEGDDFLDLNYKLDVPDGFKLTEPIKDIDSRVEIITRKIEMLSENVDPTNPSFAVYTQEINQWDLYKRMLIEEQQILKRQFVKHPILYRDAQGTQNHRWRLYWNWVEENFDIAVQQLDHLKMDYLEKNREVNVAKERVDLDILNKHEIVGLTTTAAARLHVTLQGLHAPIVLVEEAAEILEAHIVCSMTRHCQHVILIGDHKQLRPKPSDYNIGKDLNLEISLFERMVNIRGDCNQLTCQHRMRPEIVKLITPSIYETLNNDKTVYEFPNVMGLEKNLFFLNHDNNEFKHNEESWTNQFEAKFLITFARHLVKQGYDVKDITVLCTYIGQLFELRKEKNKIPILRNLYVTTVDNYQGEENRIILLSLVRNNGDGKIGFLKEENRVCVALSRAREGLYVMGNMHDLIQKNKIWPKIKKTLEEQEGIGDSLPLRCQNHPEQTMNVKKPTDFQLLCPEGGCSKICNSQLSCGHTCTSVCHILDREHEKYQCKKSCIKSCPEGHPCPLKCSEGCKPCRVLVKCMLKCGHTVDKPCSVDSNEFSCNFKVIVVLPDCEHEVEKACYLPIARAQCTHPCENRIESCGHSCTLKCHVNKDPDHVEYKCEKNCVKECANEHPCKRRCYQECGPCPVVMRKERSCGHVYPRVLCSEEVEAIPCTRPCKAILGCTHKCPMKCSQPCGNCPEKVKKISTCGHEVTIKCCEEATPAKCTGPCQKKLSCGHPCKKRCKDSCSTLCEVKIKMYQSGLCGHILSVPCYLRNNDPKDPDLLKYCDEPCGVLLECKHPCRGTCGKCLQGRIHMQCQQPCSKILICGHECSIPCREECQPCKRKCEIKCSHSKCNKKCGDPCILCNEDCTIGCVHKKCTKRCSQLCNIEPCDEPCPKRLKCEHPCVGFCGEPCPPLCRICDKDELTEIFFGNEEDEDACFVYLESCKHCIESEGLTQWMKSSVDDSIGLKRCPKCNSPIIKCMRVVNQIKNHLNNVMSVKKKIFSKNNVNLKDIQRQHVQRLEQIIKSSVILAEFKELKDLSQRMLDRGSLINASVPHRKKKQELSFQENDAFKVKLDILQQLTEILSSVKHKDTSSYVHVKKQVALIVASIPEDETNYWLITRQNLDDVQLEITRLLYLIEVCDKVTNQSDFTSILSKVLAPRRFTKDYEREIKAEMQRFNCQLNRLEREMIVKAMNLNQGHWFRCPNGHFYVITECGGAMEVGRCNECNAEIGGYDHHLLSTNSLGGEMDGATRHAWLGGLY